jgi:hypothetical protein
MKTLRANSQLALLAKRYIWWETPQWAYAHPTVFLANLMNIGTWQDIQTARRFRRCQLGIYLKIFNV